MKPRARNDLPVFRFHKPKQHTRWKCTSNDDRASDYEATWLVVTILVLVIVIDDLIGMDLIFWKFINFEISIGAVSRTQKAAAIQANRYKFCEEPADLTICLIVIFNNVSLLTSKHTHTSPPILRYNTIVQSHDDTSGLYIMSDMTCHVLVVVAMVI